MINATFIHKFATKNNRKAAKIVGTNSYFL